MSAASQVDRDAASWPRWWRLTVITIAALILCSCRGISRKHSADAARPQPVMTGGDTLPPSAWTGAPNGVCMDDRGAMPWAPPGISRPWPRDEYLHDGGDSGVPARVQADWQILGLGLEDTVAHFDTLDGKTIVEPSNRVHLYAPRFGSVRKVLGVSGFRLKESPIRFDAPIEVVVDERVLEPGTAAQRQETERRVNTKRARAQQRNAPSYLAANASGLLESINREKLLQHRRGQGEGTVLQTDEPQLAIRVQDAITWTHDKGVQVTLNEQQAPVVVGNARAQAVFEVGHEGTSKLCIVKLASTDSANPGTVVEFTLQFQNVGSESIGNVTIVDNLTTRLEYVPDSQTCSLDADFFTQPNDGDSLVLRWEIFDPLPQGKGGVIRFKCRVR